MPELEDYTQVSIDYNISRCFKIALNILKKQLSKINSSCILTSRNKQCILHDMADNSQDTIKVLIILSRTRQSSNPVQTNLFEKCYIVQNW